MQHEVPHHKMLDVFFDELREYLYDTDDNGSYEALIALDLLLDCVEPGVVGPELAEQVMLRVAWMVFYFVGRDDLPEDLRRMVNDTDKLLRPLIEPIRGLPKPETPA